MTTCNVGLIRKGNWVFIQTEETPNPNAIKFIPGRVVMEQGTADFPNREDAQRSPLATRLFDFPEVTGVFFGADFISITKSDEADWTVLKPSVLGAIMEHFVTKQPLFLDESKDENPVENDDPIVREIKEIIDTRVRPAVAMDGGDITFERFADGIVYLRLQGACSGCPSSTVTLKSGIENMLKHYVPEVVEVQAVDTEV